MPTSPEQNTTAPARPAGAPGAPSSGAPRSGGGARSGGGYGGGGTGGGGGGNRRGGGNRPPKPKSEFEEHVIQVDRVTRTVKGGRRMRFRATVVIGDKKGKVGLGIGKGNEVQAAIQKAVAKARRTMVLIPMKDDTILHPVTIKFKSARIILMPAQKGTGIIAGGAVRNVLEVAGVKNVRGKSHGTSNKLTTAQAVMAGLTKFKTAS